MNEIRKIIRKILSETLNINENLQLADKTYFKSGKLSPEIRETIIGITGSDAYTKIITDIYNQLIGNKIVDDPFNSKIQRIRKIYGYLKNYNKNVFPIQGFNVNGFGNEEDVYRFILSIENREKVIELIKKLPSIAIRNLKKEIRQERNSSDMDYYRDQLEYFITGYGLLSNRDQKFRKAIENKMFTAGVTLDDLTNFIEEKENLVGGKNFTKNSIERLVAANDRDMEIVFDKGNIMVIDVTSAYAIKKLGCNSLWCFTYGDAYKQASTNWPNYSTNDHVYVLIDFSSSTDSSEFMHVLISPLNYNPSDENDEDENNHKLFDMANQESYNPLGIVNHLVGKEAPWILHFDEPVNIEGESSKWPFEDPNQLKLDLREIKNKSTK